MFLIDSSTQTAGIGKSLGVSRPAGAQKFHQLCYGVHMCRKSEVLFTETDFLADPGKIQESQAEPPGRVCGAGWPARIWAKPA